MRKLVIVTKKFGGDFTGATLATQYFISKWKEDRYGLTAVWKIPVWE